MAYAQANHTFPKMQEICRFKQRDTVKKLAYSPTGNLLASIDGVLPNPVKPQMQISFFANLAAEVLCMAVNGGNAPFSARIWDIKKQSEKIAFPIQAEDRIDHIEFFPQNDLLATSGGHDLTVWDANGKSLKKVKMSGDTGAFCSVDNSPLVVYHSQHVLTGAKLYLYDLRSEKVLNTVEIPAVKDFIWSIDSAPQKQYIVAGGSSNRIIIWDFDSGIWVSDSFENSISKVLCHCEGEVFFCSSGSSVIIAAHAKNRGISEILMQLSIGKKITDIDLLGDNLLVCCGDNKLRIVNFRKSKTPRIEELILGDTNYRALTVATNPKNIEFAIGNGREISIWKES